MTNMKKGSKVTDTINPFDTGQALFPLYRLFTYLKQRFLDGCVLYFTAQKHIHIFMDFKGEKIK